MSKISFHVISIDFKQSILCQIRNFRSIRLNLTQKPSRIAEEYFINKVDLLKNLNHEFVINDFFNNIQKLSMTIRNADKQTNLASISNFSYFQFTKKLRKMREYKSNSDNIFQDNNKPTISLIGCFTVDLSGINRGVCNSFHAEIHSRYNNQIIGYANLKISIYNIYDNIPRPLKVEKPNNCSLLNLSIL